MNTKTEASKEGSGNIFGNELDEEFDAEKHNKEATTRTGFPKAALLLVDALKKNRACQKFIRRKMITIEAKIEENKDLRDRVKCLLDYQLSCRKAFGKILCQKEDPRVRLISSRKPCAQSTKVIIILYLHLCIGCLPMTCLWIHIWHGLSIAWEPPRFVIVVAKSILYIYL